MYNGTEYYLLLLGDFLSKRKCTTDQLRDAIEDSKLFLIQHEAVEYVPSFFGEPRLLEAGIEKVSVVLGPLPPGSKLQFFVTKKASLNSRTPLECLAAGQLRKVLNSAHGFLLG